MAFLLYVFIPSILYRRIIGNFLFSFFFTFHFHLFSIWHNFAPSFPSNAFFPSWHMFLSSCGLSTDHGSAAWCISFLPSFLLYTRSLLTPRPSPTYVLLGPPPQSVFVCLPVNRSMRTPCYPAICSIWYTIHICIIFAYLSVFCVVHICYIIGSNVLTAQYYMCITLSNILLVKKRTYIQIFTNKDMCFDEQFSSYVFLRVSYITANLYCN